MGNLESSGKVVLMLINLSPVRMDEELVMDREGDMVMLNGVEFDFSQLPEGATLPRGAIDSPWFAGPVERIDGELVLTLVLPHSANAPEETRFPEPISLSEDGHVELPAYELFPEPEEPVELEPALIEQEPEQ